MICPHCGSDQPIAEHCSQCGGDLFRTTSRITIIEEIASNKWVKIFFALSIFMAGLGTYWLFEGVENMGQPIPPSELTQSTPSAPEENNMVTGKIPSPPPLVLILGKIGEYDPLLVRNFESIFKGVIRERSVDQPGLLEEIKKEKPDYLVTLGPSAERFFAEHEKDLQELEHSFFLTLTERIHANDLRRNYLPISSRPNPESLIEVCQGILRNIEKHLIVIYDPALDQEYVDSLYGAGLEAKYNMELVEVKDGTSLKKALDQLPEDFGALLVVESLRLTTKQSGALFNHYMLTKKKPVVAVGSFYGKQGALMEVSADLSQIGKQLPQIIQELEEGTLPDDARPWLKPQGLKITLYKSNAARSKIYQVEQIAQLFEQRHPETHINYAN